MSLCSTPSCSSVEHGGFFQRLCDGEPDMRHPGTIQAPSPGRQDMGTGTQGREGVAGRPRQDESLRGSSGLKEQNSLVSLRRTGSCACSRHWLLSRSTSGHGSPLAWGCGWARKCGKCRASCPCLSACRCVAFSICSRGKRLVLGHCAAPRSSPALLSWHLCVPPEPMCLRSNF